MPPPAGHSPSPAGRTDDRWSARLDGVAVAADGDVTEPYSNPYPGLLGTPDALQAWAAEIGALRPGLNPPDLTPEQG